MKIRRGDTEITFNDVNELKQIIDGGMFDILWSMLTEEDDMLWGYSLEGEHEDWTQHSLAMNDADFLKKDYSDITFVQLSPEQEDEVIDLLVESNMFGEGMSITPDSVNEDGTINFIIESDDLPEDLGDPEAYAETLMEWIKQSAGGKSYKKEGLTSNGEKLDLNELLLGDLMSSTQADQALTEQDATVMELWKRLK